MKDELHNKPESGPQAPDDDVVDPLKDRRQLTGDDKFRFTCHSGLECFTRCCQDINILLTPTDVLALARRLGTTTGEFLDKHTQMPITKDLQLPVVMLKMGPEPDKRCAFVSEEGCGVYEDRPWACRMYPMGSALPPARAGQEIQPVHFLIEEDFCKGHGEGREWTTAQWKADQNLEHREELEKGFRELVSHPWFIGGTRHLDPKRMEMFYTSCYDLDNFRRFIFDSSFTKRFVIEPELVEQLRTDDEALLQFAYRWLRFALFAEPTMTPTDSATKAVTGATMGRES